MKSVTVVFAVWCVALAVPLAAQSLAEASAAAKVIPHEWPTSMAVTPSAPPGAADAAVDDKLSTDATPLEKEEAYWRKRQKPLLAQLAADLEGGRVVAERLAELRSRFDTSTAGAAMVSAAFLGSELTRLGGELQGWTNAVNADRLALEALTDEGRKAGARAGWFR